MCKTIKHKIRFKAIPSRARGEKHVLVAVAIEIANPQMVGRVGEPELFGIYIEGIAVVAPGISESL
jgi:hypothetical protein